MKRVLVMLLTLAFMLSGYSVVHADTDDVNDVDDVVEDNLGDIPISATTEEWTAIKELNSVRARSGLVPLATTEDMQTASRYRASELITLYSKDRPNGDYAFTLLDSLAIDYDVFGQCIYEDSDSGIQVINVWLGDEDHSRSQLLNEAYSIVGLASYNNDAWVAFLTGTRVFTSAEVVNQDVSGNNYEQGTSVEDFSQYLKLDGGDGKDYYMPIVSEMVSGYNSQTLGRQKVIIHYSDTQYAAMYVNITEPSQEYFEYSDVDDNSWYADAVQYVSRAGLFSGTSDTEFAPDANITRAMFVTVLGRLSENLGENTAGYSSSFSDVKYGSWYYNYVSWAAKKGIVEGYDSTKFGPDDNITREQVAALFERYARYVSAELDDDVGITFADSDSISSWAVDAVRKSSASGLIDGYADGTFRPENDATRAEAAIMFQRFITNFL